MRLVLAMFIMISGSILGGCATTDEFVVDGWQPLAAEIDEYFAPYDKPYSTGGVVIVMHKGEVVFQNAYGNANREWNIPWRPSTQYWTASIAKSFASQIVLLLADEGLIDINAPVKNYIPDFPDYEAPVLVWHLLSMRSGLNENMDGLHLSAHTVGGYGIGMTKDEMLQFIYSQKKLNFTPGSTKAGYENVAYGIIDRLIENVTGLSYGDAVKKYITEPWGLNATGAYEWNHFWALGDNSATAYLHAPNQEIPNIETELPYTAMHADGVMYTTPQDFAKWAKMSAYGLNGEDPMFERMIFAEQLEGLSDSRYKFGILHVSHRGHSVYHHGGYVGNRYLWAPSLDLVAVLMTNEIGKFSTHQISSVILDGYMRSLKIDAADIDSSDRPFPGRPSIEFLKARDKSQLRDIDGVFLDLDNGHIITSYKDDNAVLAHSIDGRQFVLESKKGEDTLSGMFGAGAVIHIAPDSEGLWVEGWGNAVPKQFFRVTPKPADGLVKESITGIFYDDEWGSKYEIIRSEDGGVELWTGDRSVAGRAKLKQITDGHWIAGSLETGDFWSLKFQDKSNKKFNEFIFHSSTVRNKRFRRMMFVQ